MKAPTDPGSLVTRSEIRKMLPDVDGKPMSRQRVSEVVEQDAFPAPIDVVRPGSAQPIWRKVDVVAWQRDHRRGPGRPPDAVEGAIVPDQPLS